MRAHRYATYLRGQHFVEGDAFAESRGGDPRGAEGDDADDAAPAGCGVTIVDESTTVYVMLKGSVEPSVEIAKLEKKVVATLKQIAELAQKMAMDGYEDKVPESVRNDNAEKKEKFEAEVAVSESAVEEFKKLL